MSEKKWKAGDTAYIIYISNIYLPAEIYIKKVIITTICNDSKMVFVHSDERDTNACLSIKHLFVSEKKAEFYLADFFEENGMNFNVAKDRRFKENKRKREVKHE